MYLAQRYSTTDKTKTKRFKEESRLDGQHSPCTATSSCLKRQVYNLYVLSTMTYGAETCALIIKAKNKLAAAQIKRSMLNLTYRDRKYKHLGKRNDVSYLASA